MNSPSNKIKLTKELQTDSISEEFKISKRLRRFFLVVLMSIVLISFGLPLVKYFMTFAIEKNDIGLFLPGILLIPFGIVIFMMLLKLNTTVRYTDDSIIIYSKNSIQEIRFDEIIKLQHHFFSHSISIKNSNSEYFISKYLDGFEFLFQLIINKTSYSFIELGKKQKLLKVIYIPLYLWV